MRIRQRGKLLLLDPRKRHTVSWIETQIADVDGCGQSLRQGPVDVAHSLRGHGGRFTDGLPTLLDDLPFLVPLRLFAAASEQRVIELLDDVGRQL